MQVGLIVALVLGTAGMGAFVGVQIAQEGRTAVRAVTEALPAWSVQNPGSMTTKQVRVSAGSELWLSAGGILFRYEHAMRHHEPSLQLSFPGS